MKLFSPIISGSVSMSAGSTLFGTASQALTASYIIGSAFSSANPVQSASYASGSTSASFATTASFASNFIVPSIYITTGSGTSVQSISGSLIISGSTLTARNGLVVSGSTDLLTVSTGTAVEFQVTSTGTKKGNMSTDIHQVTGSLNISGSQTNIGDKTVIGNTTITGSLSVSGSSHTIVGNTALSGSIALSGSLTFFPSTSPASQTFITFTSGTILRGYTTSSVGLASIFFSSSLIPIPTVLGGVNITSSFGLGTPNAIWKEIWVGKVNTATKTINFFDETLESKPTRNAFSIGDPYIAYLDSASNPVYSYPVSVSGSLTTLGDFYTTHLLSDTLQFGAGFAFNNFDNLVQVGEYSPNYSTQTTALALYNGNSVAVPADPRVSGIGLFQTETPLYYAPGNSVSTILLASGTLSPYIYTPGLFQIQSGINIVVTGSSPLPANLTSSVPYTIYVATGSTYTNTINNIANSINFSSSISPFSDYLSDITASFVLPFYLRLRSKSTGAGKNNYNVTINGTVYYFSGGTTATPNLPSPNGLYGYSNFSFGRENLSRYGAGFRWHTGIQYPNNPVGIVQIGDYDAIFNKTKIELIDYEQYIHLSASVVALNGSLRAPSITGSLQGSASYASNGGVTQIIAGPNISLSPTNGMGAVTITSTGGSGGGFSNGGANISSSFVSSSTWSFTHNLGNKGVIIQTFDSNWNQILPQTLTLTDTSSATITFPGLQSGYAIASLGGLPTNLSGSLIPQGPVASYQFKVDSATFSGSNVLRYVSDTAGIIATGSFTGSFTGALAGTASWANNVITSSYALTASYAINAGGGGSSFPYTGSAIISGSLVVTGSTTSTLGFTGSLQGTSSWANNAITASYALNAGAGSGFPFSGSAVITGSLLVSGSGLTITGSVSSTQGFTGSLQGTSSWATNVLTASYANNFTVAGTLTAQTIVAQTITSSTDYVTGSSRFGSLLTNTHQFTGSVSMTGSLNVTGNGITGSLFGTSSWATKAQYILAANVVGSGTDFPFLLYDPNSSNFVQPQFNNNLTYNFSTQTIYATSSNASVAITSSYPISVAGSTLFSTSPLTSPSFAGLFQTHSIFLGLNAGFLAITASNSNFFGYNAGSGSTSANNSNFFGNQVGVQATSANNSNFFGNLAGYKATGANNSNFFGNNAGYSASSAYYSNFLGYLAGNNATNANSSNFLGYTAGSGATNGFSSNFIGVQAGQTATNANNSNFIGNLAGYQAISASFSTLIGYQAGYSNNFAGPSIGRNNIIIGTNITLPNGTQDSINLGGIIFATGSYSSSSGLPYSGSQVGRVGINKLSPIYNLDVSGSGNFSNGLTVTGSLVATSNVLIVSALTVGTSSLGSNENTLVLGPPPSGGTGEGGQILLQASGGLYTSASMLDNYQNKFRVLRGTNAGSDAFKLQIDLHTGQIQIPNYTGSGAFPGTYAGYLAVDPSGNIVTSVGSGGSTTPGGLNTQIQYNNSNAFGGVPVLTYDGTTLKATGSFTGSFTGALAGTASWANNALTASYSNNLVVSGTLTLDSTLTDYNLSTTTAGVNTLFTQTTSSYNSAFGKYTALSGSNARAGEFVTVWNGGLITYYDNSTTDIGSTSNVVFSASFSGANILLQASASAGWTIKMLTTYI